MGPEPLRKVLLLSFVGGLALWAVLWLATPAFARVLPGMTQIPGSTRAAPSRPVTSLAAPRRPEPVRTAPSPSQYRRTQELAPRAYSVIEVPGSPGPGGIGYYHLVIRDGDLN
jgi:hypothetical protein